MRKSALLITALCMSLFAYTFCEANSSPEVNIGFMNGGSVQRNYSKAGIVPGKAYNFDVKFQNLTGAGATIKIGFVDGTITNDSLRLKACLQDGEGEKLGNYIQGAETVYVPAKSTVVKNYSFQLPRDYKYSGQIPGCITIATLDNQSDAGVFKVVTRKANFIDINVVPVDTTPPTIISCSMEDGATNVSKDSVITVTFSEAMDKPSVRSAISLDGSFVLDWNEDNTQIYIRPVGSFAYNTEYTLTIGTGASDYYLNELTGGLTVHFTTEEYIEPEPEEKTPGYSGGGSSHNDDTIKPYRDNCPNGDFSDSLFDGSCGDYNEVEERHGAADGNGCSAEGSIYGSELDGAYIFACNLGITTMPTIDKADMMGPLLRKHLAKMISEFAIKVVGTPINYERVCEFDDMDQESQEMQYYAQLSCQLGLMGLHSDGISVKDSFDPNERVTRAQFGTVLSRLLWGTTYAPEDPNELYYTKHLEALRRNAIMTEIYGKRPNSIELRGRVMLMLQRVNENNLISNKDSNEGNYIDRGHINVSINNNDNATYYTNKDSIQLNGKIDQSQYVSEIHVTHLDSKGVAQYDNYALQKYTPGDTNFYFYADRSYNSLTINDSNEYQFDFYNEDGEIISKSIITINHNYSYKG